MLVKLFGAMDIIAGIILVYLSFVSHSSVAFFFVAYLILKGLLFFCGLVSIMDITSGIVIGLAATGNFYAISWIFVLWLIQKGLLSLLI